MSEIVMPRIGANDDSVTIGQWVVKNGEYVKQKQLIAILETTKETKELFSRYEGYITLNYSDGDEVSVGTVICSVSESEKKNDSVPVNNISTSSNITEKALQLIKKNNMDISLFPSDKIIKEKDVIALLSSEKKDEDIPDGSLSNHLYIVGTGGFTREIITIIRQTFAYQIDGIIGGIGDLRDKDQIMGIPIICKTNEVDKLLNSNVNKLVNAVAVSPKAHSRCDIYDSFKKKNYEFPNIIHKSAIFGTDIRMGEGNIILADAVIGSEVVIGNDCIINVNSTVSHQCSIGDSTHIASGAVIAGNVKIGKNTLIGQNVSIYNDVTIGNNVIIQNGVSVFKDVPDDSIVKN